MNISPIMNNSLTFSMKFTPEIEVKCLSHLRTFTDENKKQEFIKLKKEADNILSRISYNNKDIKYGSIVRKNGKDYFRHSINLHNKTTKLSTDDTDNIDLFLGHFLWSPLEELTECIYEVYPHDNKPIHKK